MFYCYEGIKIMWKMKGDEGWNLLFLTYVHQISGFGISRFYLHSGSFRRCLWGVSPCDTVAKWWQTRLVLHASVVFLRVKLLALPCKQGVFSMQTRLLRMTKKPCLQCNALVVSLLMFVCDWLIVACAWCLYFAIFSSKWLGTPATGILQVNEDVNNAKKS